MSELTDELLAALRQLDTCTVANAVEDFETRLRNEGFTNASIRCLFGHLPPLVGYAVTARIRCSSPHPAGHHYFDRTDWWQHVLKTPAPRVVVLQDIDVSPGFGSFLGEVHISILKALGCVGAVTNGGVRDLPAVAALQFPLFAGSVAVSHAYAHFVDFGSEVEIGGLKINSGDLLHGDQHGLVSIPHQIAPKLPAVARRLRAKEQGIVALCQSPTFSLERLVNAVKGYTSTSPAPLHSEARDEFQD